MSFFKENTLIQKSKKVKNTFPILGVFAFSFFIYFLGGSIGEKIINQFSSFFLFIHRNNNIFLLFSEIFIIILIISWIIFFEKRNIESIGITKNKTIELLKGFSYSSLLLIILFFIISLFSKIEVKYFFENFSLLFIIKNLFFLLAWFTQAASEEILIRGWALPMISSKSNIFLGIILSSILFVLIHAGNSGFNILSMLNIFLVGILLAYFTLKTNRIYIAIGFHAGWNFILSNILGLSVSGSKISELNILNIQIHSNNIFISGGIFGVESSIILTGILVLILVLVLVKNKKNK